MPKQLFALDGTAVQMMSNGSIWLSDILKLATVLCLRLIVVGLLLLTMWSIWARSGWASEVDMSAISLIESSGGKHLIGDGGHAHGQYQVSDITIREYEQMTGNPGKNYDEIAHWYMEKRIPQLLRHFKIPVTTKTKIWAYNAGIGNVVKGRIPKTTSSYFRKYEKLTGVSL